MILNLSDPALDNPSGIWSIEMPRSSSCILERIAYRIKRFLPFLLLFIILIFLRSPKNDCAFAEEPPAKPIAPGERGPGAQSEDGEYHTPLAGEPFHTTFRGQAIDIPRRDRGNQTALILGGAVYAPSSGDTAGLPVFALYLKRMREDARLRAVASGVVNEVDVARSFGNFELLGRFENYTIPFFSEKGIQDNNVINQSSVQWGTLSTFFGAGLRFPVAPYQVDNDLRLQLFGQVGYMYSQPTSDTPSNVTLPPDTMLYGMKLRGRYDGIRRNLLELPHTGTATGFDLDFTHREHWSDFGNPVVTFKKEDTQDYLKLSAYWVGVFGIPGLSEENRFLVTVHGGLADKKSIDRYNAFRLSSGIFVSEADDLSRPDYPGALIYQALVSDYLLLNLEYRRELFFFMYLHLRGTFIWADGATVIGSNQIGFTSTNGQAASVGLTTGFFWDSQLYLESAWDSGFLRNGKPGGSMMLIWSKSF